MTIFSFLFEQKQIKNNQQNENNVQKNGRIAHLTVEQIAFATSYEVETHTKDEIMYNELER